MARKKTKGEAAAETAEERQPITQPSEEEYLRDCLHIAPEVIQEEFVRLPGDLAYWNQRYSEALEAALNARHERKKVRGELWLNIKTELLEDGHRATEKVLDNSVDSHPDYVDACMAEAKAEAEKARVYGILDSVRAKKEMLISLGAQLRQEMEHDPTIREQVGARRRMGYEGG